MNMRGATLRATRAASCCLRAQPPSPWCGLSTTRAPLSTNSTNAQQVQSKAASPSTASSASSANASNTSKAAGSARRAARRPTPAETVATWFNRGMYAVGGMALAAGAAMYVTDPKGTKAAVMDVYNDIEERIRFFTEPSSNKLLPDFKPRYPGDVQPRTIIVDLDEILVYSTYSRSTGWRIAKRPGADAFLAYLFNFYELVVFTSKLPHYVDPILASLDSNGYVQHRLYRPETKFERGVFVKDLSVLNRDLARTIVIDHDMKNVKYHRDNAIEVPKWTGDPSDTVLLDLVPFLESLAKEDVADVREHLALFRSRSVKEAVAMHKAMAPERLEKAQEKQGFFFGGPAAPPPPPPPAEEGSEDVGNEMLGSISSRLFRTSGSIDVPKEAEVLKKRS